jgi:hypothetical protein
MGLIQVPAVSGGVASKSAKISSGSVGGTYTFNNTFEPGQYIVNQTAAASFTLGGTTVSNTSVTPITVTSSTSSLGINISSLASWTSGTAPSVGSNPEGGISIANGFLYVMGGDAYARTSDGITWTAITSGGIMGECNTVFYNGVYVTGAYISSYGRIFSSTDGLNWTERVSQFGSAAGRPPKAVATNSGATNKFAISGNSGHLYYSTNGTSWTQGSNFSQQIFGMISNNTTYVAVGAGSLISTSTDGQNWTTRTQASSPGTWWDVAFGNGLFVAVGDSGHINTSTDGTTWVNRTSTSGTTQGIRSVAYNASAGYPWMAGLANGSALFSTDGINWISRTTGISSTVYGVDFYNSAYRAVGSPSSYRYTTNINGSLSSDYYANFIGPSTTTTVTS